MKQIIAFAKQTVFDIAMQELGSAQGVWDILDANAFLRIDQEIPAGTLIFIPPDAVVSAQVVDYYTRNSLHPVSGLGEIVTITDENMIDKKQIVNYDLAGGNVTFDGQRMANMGDELTVQINYSEFTGVATAFAEQSLDGINYSAIPGASVALDEQLSSLTINISGIVTNYVRVRIEAIGANGSIGLILFRV